MYEPLEENLATPEGRRIWQIYQVRDFFVDRTEGLTINIAHDTTADLPLDIFTVSKLGSYVVFILVAGRYTSQGTSDPEYPLQRRMILEWEAFHNWANPPQEESPRYWGATVNGDMIQFFTRTQIRVFRPWDAEEFDYVDRLQELVDDLNEIREEFGLVPMAINYRESGSSAGGDEIGDEAAQRRSDDGGDGRTERIEFIADNTDESPESPDSADYSPQENGISSQARIRPVRAIGRVRPLAADPDDSPESPDSADYSPREDVVPSDAWNRPVRGAGNRILNGIVPARTNSTGSGTNNGD